MTVENCKKLLELYEAKMNDDSLPEYIRKQSKLNYENMKKHVLDPKSRKFRDSELRKTLMAGPVKEVKKVGKKSA